MSEKKTSYIDTFNDYNRYEQEIRFLNQKYAPLLNKNDGDLSWFDDFKKLMAEYKINIDKKELREKGLLEILSQLSEDDSERVINFFWIEDENRTDDEIDELNNVYLTGLLSDVNRYRTIKKGMEEMLKNEDNRAIIQRMGKIIKKDLLTTLNNEKPLLESGTKVKLQADRKKFTKERSRGGKTSEVKKVEFKSQELNDKYTTSILTFHEIQKIYSKYNYVFTLRDLKDTHKILESMEKGEMVMMTGDTGSGKTELALLISSLYLDKVYGDNRDKEKKEPILVTGNADVDFSDLSVEKIITSKNALSDQNDAILGDENEKEGVKSVLHLIEKEKEIRDEAERLIDDDEELSEDEKLKKKEKLKDFDMFKYNIFTDYHLKGITKAMANGVPLILDEINGISPEILLGLNHYFTRRVGQTISIGNGFAPITIKEGFCIICTGNDKNENSKVMRYQGRYDIDESLLNRMYRVCKGYYKQNVNETNFNNANSGIEENENEEVQSQIDYMNENELYGVILMLCFNKKGNDKNVHELSDETVLKKMISTQSTGFNLIKESFSGKTEYEAKQQVFGELKKLSKFIHYVQDAYQKKTVMIGGDEKVDLNYSSFSMRQLVRIIQDWKTDTKTLWYHLYNDYIKQIPPENTDRYWIYKIAEQSGFELPKIHLEKDKPDLINLMTTALENQQNEEFHKNANTRNAQINETNIDETVLDKQIIITKQDMYKEYFGKQFGDINDTEFENEIKEEENEMKEKKGLAEGIEDLETVKKKVKFELKGISGYLKDGTNKYIDGLKSETLIPLQRLTAVDDSTGNFVYMDIWEKSDEFKDKEKYGDSVFRMADLCLGAILQEFYNRDDYLNNGGENDLNTEVIANNIKTLTNLKK